jgi:S1-C subfamily serine protease
MGVAVVNVEANSPADRAGIIPGDVILGINKQPINNLSEYEGIISGLKGDALVRTSRGYFLVKSE